MYLDKAALSQEKKHAVGIGKQVRAGMSGTAIQHLTKQQAQSSMGAPAIHTVPQRPQRDGVPLVTLAG